MSNQRITEMIQGILTDNEKGIRASSYATDYVYQGKCFSISQRFTIVPDTNLIILFDPTGCAVKGKEVSVYPPVFSGIGGPVNVDLYAGTDYAGGTLCTIMKRAYYGNNNCSIITYGAEGSYKGLKFSENMILADKKGGGSTSDLLEFVPPQSSKILIELDNTDTSDAVVLIQFVWFEI